MTAQPESSMNKRFDIEYISAPREHAFIEEWYQYNNEDHFWFAWRLAAFLRQLLELNLVVQQQAVVLDIGSGTGMLVRQLERHTGWRVDGTDLNEIALKHHYHGRGRTLYYDIMEERDEFHEHYDFIILFDVLEHLSAPEAFLRSALGHLKPGGHLFINVPALQWLYSRYDVVAGHYHRYNKRSLSHLLDGLPVDILDRRYWGLSMIPLLLGRKLLSNGFCSDQNVISRGFQPSSRLVHQMLRLLMGAETRLIKRPWLGTSVLLAAQKKSVPDRGEEE